MTETNREGEPTFGLVDVGILILEAVGLLHSRGHQLLRVHPGMSGSGMHWRTAITVASNFTDGNKHAHLKSARAALHYSTGSGFEVMGARVDTTTTLEEMADRITASLPDAGLGRDWSYAGWYVEMLGLVRRHHTLPITYADYFDPEDGWEIGWGSGVRMVAPALPDDAANGTAQCGNAIFTGTLQQFNRYLGPHWRVVVQQISKKHKSQVGACEFNPTHDGPFDAAHIHGRSRTALLRKLLNDPAKDDVFTVELGALAARFAAEHDPIEKSILVLCKPCHKTYDAPAVADPLMAGVSAQSETAASEVPSGTLVLPITLEPRGVEEFKAALLSSRAAWIEIRFGDGRVERVPWLAAKLTSSSNIIANLRSRPMLRQGTWQEHGIAAVHVVVTTEAEIAGYTDT